MLTELVHDEQLALLTRKACPGPGLLPIITSYIEPVGSPLIIRYLPDLAFSLRFNLGGPFCVNSDGISMKFDDHILLPHRHGWVDEGNFFTVRFRFGILPCHLGPGGFPASPVRLRGLVSQEYISNIERASNFEERVAISNEYFSSSLTRQARQLKECNVLASFLEELEKGSSANFHTPAFVSPKSLQRYCLRHFGISPKGVQCILRVRKALAAYFSSVEPFNVYDFNYYDYSHFYKEVRRLTGLNLSELHASAFQLPASSFKL